MAIPYFVQGKIPGGAVAFKGTRAIEKAANFFISLATTPAPCRGSS